MEHERLRAILRLEYLLGFLMAAVGIIDIYNSMQYWSDGSKVVFTIASDAVLLVGGSTLALSRTKSMVKTAGFYALCLGMSRMISSSNGLLNSSWYMMAASAAMFLLGLNLAYSGIRYLTGVSRNAATMRYTSSAIALLYALLFVYILHLNVIGDGLMSVYSAIIVLFTSMMYGLFSYTLHSDEVWSRTFIGRTKDDIHAIRSSFNFASGAAVDRKDAMAIRRALDGDIPSCSCGPVTGEISVTVFKRDERSRMLMERWDGRTGLRLTLMQDTDGSYYGGTDTVIKMEPEGGDIEKCQAFRLYCESGRSLRLLVRGVKQ
jgi:hypothetical protein